MAHRKRNNILKGAASIPTEGYHKDITELEAKLKGKNTGPTKRFNVEIPVSLHRQLKAEAAKEGFTLSELAIQLFKEYLSKRVNE